MQPDYGNPDPVPTALILLFYAIPFIGLVLFGLIGAFTERAHFKSIRLREETGTRPPVSPTRTWEQDRIVAETRLVAASVVVSLDYFKRFLAKLRNLIGGRVRSYESLLDRARREAILRLQDECPGADIILNFRMETSSIANTRGKQGAGGVEVLAYGTMVKYAAPGTTPPRLG
jgi:uncharacterized protein YbjQ (UPF0145 family)